MNERWEQVARVLKTERVSNGEIARRLRIAPRFVSEVRADLGIAPYRYRRPSWTQDDFDEMTVQLRGRHRLWLGRVSQDGTPMVSNVESAYRLGFRLYHGREPVGRIRGGCRKKWCVAGPHLRDKVMRDLEVAEFPAELPAGATWCGMDLVAVRRALRGDGPYPALGLEEKKLAARYADPLMPDKELARRLDCCPKSAKSWRDEGAAS